jgi:uncharacterized membrane protein
MSPASCALQSSRPSDIVSLEAIFLSTFVMIGQNRQAAFQQAKADHDFQAETSSSNPTLS